MNPLRILLIADDPLARAGLASFIAEEPDLDVVMQLAATDDVLHSAGEPPYVDYVDAALWDMGWAASGLEQIENVIESALPTLALLPDGDWAGRVWSAGVRGLLLRDSPPVQIVAALEAIAAGLVVVAPELASALPLARSAAEEAYIVEALTPREFDVLQLLAEGAANKAIARRLDISENTVKYHVNAILGKLGAQSRTEAVVRATRAGLILL